MNQSNILEIVEEIMLDFALITGIDPPLKHPKRYLWTDAFAVCNYLELYNQSNDKRFLDLSLKLVDQVHHILGCYHLDDTRKGWISGLNKEDGEAHPTKGGLRIGKELNERPSDEPFNERLEWDRDGQYYHYLTKWMHALIRVSIITNDSDYARWALELVQAAHKGFTYNISNGMKRMYWKMSIDLSRPLVSSMGQHDPLDGYITYLELQETGKDIESYAGLPDITPEIVDIVQIFRGMSWVTEDPLGIGGLLADSLIFAQLNVKSSNSDERNNYEKLLRKMLESAQVGLEYYARNNPQNYPAAYRLAFREMGLSIGIKGVDYLYNILKTNKGKFEHYNHLKQIVKSLSEFTPLAVSLDNFWLKDENRKINTWTEHREINMVMLATSLMPCGFLKI